MKPFRIQKNTSRPRELYEVFKHKELVDAMLDRLNHGCTVIRIDGPSLRVPKSSEAPAKQKTPQRQQTQQGDAYES